MEKEKNILLDKRKYLENFLNDFLLEFYEEKKLMFDNIGFINYLNFQTYIFWEDFFDINDLDVDWNDVTKFDFFQNKALIEQFFSDMGLDFDFEKIIIDGVLDINYNDKNDVSTFDKLEFPNLFGSVSDDDKNISILLNDNGLITDSSIWVHEISHYRNRNIDCITEERLILSESISFAMQFIFNDYLFNLGYENDAKMMMYSNFKLLFNNARKSVSIFRLFLIYLLYGDIKEETYNMRFSKEYDLVIEDSYEQIKDCNYAIFYKTRYSVAFPLATYMYINYKKDNNFLNNIEKLNNALKEEHDIKFLLKIIGINEINYDIINIFKENYTLMANELINVYGKAKTLSK